MGIIQFQPSKSKSIIFFPEEPQDSKLQNMGNLLRNNSQKKLSEPFDMHRVLQNISLSWEINYKLLYVLRWPLESIMSARHYIWLIIKVFALPMYYSSQALEYILCTYYIIHISTEFSREYEFKGNSLKCRKRILKKTKQN